MRSPRPTCSDPRPAPENTGPVLSRDSTPGSAMITIHHLGVSQSDRVVWLMEELGLPYHLKWYKRGPDLLAPPEFLALHPAATAPIIEDGDMLLAESGAIVEYICHRHG